MCVDVHQFGGVRRLYRLAIISASAPAVSSEVRQANAQLQRPAVQGDVVVHGRVHHRAGVDDIAESRRFPSAEQFVATSRECLPPARTGNAQRREMASGRAGGGVKATGPGRRTSWPGRALHDNRVRPRDKQHPGRRPSWPGAAGEMPAAVRPLNSASAMVLPMPSTSPVDFISGPR